MAKIGSRHVGGLVVAALAASCSPTDGGGESWEDVAEREGAVRICADGPTVQGIDVSHHNDVVDWPAVAATDVKFAFVRVSDGLQKKDTRFGANWSGAKAAGLVRGVYQYFRPSQSAEAQAELLLDAIASDPIGDGDLPAVLDVETSGGLSNAKVRARMQTWLDLVESGTGKKPIVYTAAFMQDVVGSGFDGYPLWVANFTKKCPLIPSGFGGWKFWQYSESGSVDGVDSPVDRDVFNGSLDDLLAFAGGGAPPDPGPGPDPNPDPDPKPDPGGVWTPAPKTSWQWQLTGTIDTSLGVTMYDVDLFDAPDEKLAKLHADGHAVICYFSAGTREDWRSDAGSFKAGDYGNGVDGWAGETWLDVRSANVRAIMKKRLDLAKARGCNGVEPDNVDGYSNDSGFPLTAQHQIDFDTFLATEAHARGLSVGLKNALDLVPDLVGSFDWALNEQCLEYDECDTLHPFLDAGKAVFHVEYASSSGQGASKKSQVCGKPSIQGFSTLIKTLDLGAWRLSCD